jgi:hypothetical protein
MDQYIHAATRHVPWNKGKLVGQKAPLKLKDIWAIRVHLQIQNRTRELALFNLAIDSKLRSCDLVKLRVRTIRAPPRPMGNRPLLHIVRGLLWSGSELAVSLF